MLWREGDYEIDTEPSRIDLNRVYAYLRTTYWANDRSFAAVRASWEHSHLVFGLYAIHLGSLQIGCARVVTDTYSFGWLADVFVAPDFRGKGLGKFLMRCVVEHPDCRDLRLFVLGTLDAHGLYEQFGWEKPRHPERFLIRYKTPPAPT